MSRCYVPACTSTSGDLHACAAAAAPPFRAHTHVPLALLGLDVGAFVKDTIEAIVDLVVPDFCAGWVSSVATWLVALPDVTGTT